MTAPAFFTGLSRFDVYPRDWFLDTRELSDRAGVLHRSDQRHVPPAREVTTVPRVAPRRLQGGRRGPMVNNR